MWPSRAYEIKVPEVSKVQAPPAVTRLFMMEFLSCLICTSPRETELGCVKGKAVWKIVGNVCQGVEQQDFRKTLSKSLPSMQSAILMVKIAMKLTSRISIASSLKYPREKDGDEDTEFFGGTKSTMSWVGPPQVSWNPSRHKSLGI